MFLLKSRIFIDAAKGESKPINAMYRCSMIFSRLSLSVVYQQAEDILRHQDPPCPPPRCRLVLIVVRPLANGHPFEIQDAGETLEKQHRNYQAASIPWLRLRSSIGAVPKVPLQFQD